MKKTILGVFTAMAIINNVSAAEQKLPDPNREGGMPADAGLKRKTFGQTVRRQGN